MHELLGLSYRKLKELLANKKLSTIELTNVFLESANRCNSKYNAYREITEEYAKKQAAASQERINAGLMGKIECMPIGVKDNYCTKGVLTTACSKMLENFIPTYESTVTDRLFKEGGVMIGKTNMDEFAMGSSNTNSYFGSVINPYKALDSEEDFVAGGSSGGSAAAVAAKMCLGAIGSDTGGSVRLPAAFTGTVGVKPTYGRCSRYGIIALASSLDQAGVFANDISDAALLLEAICGFDAKDSTSKNLPSPDILSHIGKDVKGMKIGIPKEYEKDGINPCITKYWEKAKEWFLEAGAYVISISLPHTDYALPTYYIINPAEASSNLARYDGVRYGLRAEEGGDNFQEMIERTRSQYFGKEVKRRIISGTYVLSSDNFAAYYQKAQKVRRLIANDFLQAFSKVDAILTPISANPAFGIHEKSNPIDMYYNDLFTIPASLAGLPCISIPVGSSKNQLPLGLQLINKHYDEANMFRFANIIEKNSEFSRLK
ncbi:Asp-tRNA(Asn)/Glu-tRNA(Gln) amidotransferase subunit GatA [Candidatus Bandiella euplotis]|uniref:Glutamyl-tRNA(Gln) amidotransferase subunit A n=1 Tax=Candidatus Bandiella euplotis TaxID=1664265 RepID=A0ABZ0URK4_9RICK|nr:Asp-tRNA(Asn)/Glu-tRNA(Gln) amidotransferase subunit GatA [Candidatus Bandiella woodruffii]WPX96665.1 Glutamyl-tRNA(Gln) amidotransferase subunit A [Candidatus Bandiella woodruffii]